MKFKKEDVLEALGIDTGSSWLPTALAGFGVGCIVGAAVAMLLAPKSGRELRSDIMDKGRDLMGRAKDQFAKVEDSVSKPNIPTY